MGTAWIQLAQMVLILTLAPLAVGALASLQHRFQGRAWLPFFQTYTDIAKLFRKKACYPQNASPLYPVLPFVIFGASLLLCFYLPVMIWNHGQAIPASATIVFVYLLGLMAFAEGLLTHEVSVGFGRLGAGRLYYLQILLEALLLLSLFAMVPQYAGQATGSFQVTKGVIVPLMVLCVVFVAFLAEGRQLPFDDEGTNLELTMIAKAISLGLNGPLLAFVAWSGAVKTLAFLCLIARLLSFVLLSIFEVSQSTAFFAGLVLLMLFLPYLQLWMVRTPLVQNARILIIALAMVMVGIVLSLTFPSALT